MGPSMGVFFKSIEKTPLDTFSVGFFFKNWPDFCSHLLAKSTYLICGLKQQKRRPRSVLVRVD
jgi:hypothetical protein